MFYFINIDNPSKSYSYDKGKLFESLCEKVIKLLGYRSIEMRAKRDNLEYDLAATSNITRYKLIGEAKAYEKKVSNEILSFLGKMHIHWIDDPNTIGLFISLSELTADVKGHIDKVISVKKNFLYITSERIMEILSKEANYLSYEQVKQRTEKLTGNRSGETYLLVTDRGEFYIQLIIPNGKTLPSLFCCFDYTGNLITDEIFLNMLKVKIDVLKELQIQSLKESASSGKQENPVEVINSFMGVLSGKGWFDYQFPAPPEKFIGRGLIIKKFLEEIDEIKAGSANIRVFEILSRSGVGKSSITLKLDNEINNRNDVGVVIDSRNLRTTLDFLNIIQLLILNINKKYDTNFDLPTTQKEVISCFATLNKFLTSNNIFAVVFLDQFESVFSKPKIYNFVIDYICEFYALNYRVVFSISRKNDQPTTYDESSEIDLNRLKIISKCFLLKDFELPEAEALIEKMNKEIGRPLIKPLKEQVLEISNGFPWLLKKFCSHIIKLIKEGHTQTNILQSGMQLQDLFKEELDSLDEILREFFDRLVSYLPATQQELTEVFNDDDLSYKLKILQNDYRLIRLTGRTYDTYNDVLKEYVKTGKISLSRRYILRLHPKPVLKLFNEIIENKWTSIDDIILKRKEAKGNIFNKLRELKQLEFIEGNYESFKPTDLAIKAFNETTIPEYLNSVLKQNGLVREILGELSKQKVLENNSVGELLKREMPFIDAQDSTWLYYSSALGNWLKVANLANYKSGSIVVLKSSDLTLKHLYLTTHLPSIYMQQLERFINVLSQTKTPQTSQQLAQKLGRKSINGAVVDSEFLGLIDALSRGNYILSDEGRLYAEMDANLKKKFIAEKLESIEYINQYITEVKIGIEPDVAFNNLVSLIGVDYWNESTTNWRHKLLRNWLMYADLISRKKLKLQEK